MREIKFRVWDKKKKWTKIFSKENRYDATHCMYCGQYVDVVNNEYFRKYRTCCMSCYGKLVSMEV